MKELAQGLASLGRNGDSMLVHMTPKEVQGLQQLALAKGGSLTVNPHTGLPEAFDLGDIFEFAAPIVGGIVGGPIGAGLAGGLTSYMRHGDLGKAALSGAMSWGLGSLGEGFEKVGETALGNTSTATNLGRDLITQQSAITPETFGSMPSDLAGVPTYQNLEGVRYYADPNAPGQWTTSNYAANTPNVTPADVPNAPGYYNTNPPSYLDKMSAGWNQVTSSGKNAMDFLSANQMPIAAAGLGALGMMAPQQAAMPGAQAKTGYAPRYTWNPQTRQYENAAPSPYTYYAAGGGEVPYPSGTASYPQSRIEGMAYSLPSANPVSANVVGALPKTDYDARITQQGDVFTAAAGAYVPKSKGASTDIYKETFDPESAKEDQDLMGLIAKLSRNPNKDYAQGGTIKMADGGLFGALTASPEFQQLLKGSIAPAPARYSYDPRDQRYTQMAQGGAIKMADGGFMGNALPGMFGIISQMPEFANLVDKSRVSYSYDPKDQHYARMAQGGVAGLKEGAFVLPADVVAHLGNGSSKAGHEVAAKRLGAHPVSGRGDGMSDSISTTIDGKQPARIADGEAIVPPEQVKKIGRGSTDAGAKRLYSMMDKVRQARTGTKKQGRQINPEKFMPA